MQIIDPTPDLPEFHSPPFQIHGVLVRALDCGVLILGESGTGKSECALALIRKGHQLVADDVVEIHERPDAVFGQAPELTYCLLEVRGLGVVNVGVLFGADTICPGTEIDLCVELTRSMDIDRLPVETLNFVIGEKHLPLFVVPVGDGRDLASIIETAVLLHQRGLAHTVLTDDRELVQPIQ